MKKIRDTLTHEALTARFQSQFDLVTHAIHLAEEVIASGRKPIKTPYSENNIALQILDEIASGDNG